MTDELVTERLYGNYRAKVINNKDKDMFGRVMVYIPDLMPALSSQDKNGLWARPANNPIGGRNTTEGTDENHYMGSCYIPRIGAWVWIFFESGNINRPYYFGGLDIEHAKVLPENQLGTNYEDKWTIFKSHEGRTVVISDDDDDQRVEITGTKRKMLETKEAPSGDIDSVYQIDENMTTILFDERSGKEKVLIRTYKGDFFHIDIDERKLQAEFESDIVIKTNGKFLLSAKDSVNIRSEEKSIKLAALEDIHIFSATGDIRIDATSADIHLLTGTDMYQTVGGSHNTAVQNDHIVQSGNQMSRRAGSSHDTDAGANVNVQSGTSKAAQSGTAAEVAEEARPEGERDT